MFLHVGVPASPSSFLLTPFATTTLPFYQHLISSLPISDQRDALAKTPPTNHLRAQLIAPACAQSHQLCDAGKAHSLAKAEKKVQSTK